MTAIAQGQHDQQGAGHDERPHQDGHADHGKGGAVQQDSRRGRAQANANGHHAHMARALRKLTARAARRQAARYRGQPPVHQV